MDHRYFLTGKRYGTRRSRVRWSLLVLLVTIVGCNRFGPGRMRHSTASVVRYFSNRGIGAFRLDTVYWDGRCVFRARTEALSAPADSAPVFVFVHGSPGDLSNVLPFLADSLVRARGMAVGYDRPGYGHSDPAPVLSLRRQAEALRTVWRDLPGRKILVAHSYGAPVAVQAAIDYPDEVGGLVLAGPVVHTVWRPRAWWRSRIAKPPLRWLVARPLLVSNAEMRALQTQLDSADLAWSQVRCPVLILQGWKDWLAVPSNAAYADSALIHAPSKTVQSFPDKGHFFFLTKPQVVVAALTKWYDREMKGAH